MRTCALVSVMMVGGSAWAGGPSNQLSNFGSVVRVLAGLSTPQTVGEFRGTGTIIGHKNIGGQGWLVVLTADHVVAAGGFAVGGTVADVGIAAGNDPTGASNGLKAGFVARMGSQKVDLAVLGINYGAYNDRIRNMRSLAAVDPAQPPASFTSMGFGMGLDPDNTANEWKPDGNFGTQRFYNNKQYTITNGAIATANGYVNQCIEWKSLAPGDANAMDGQGSIWIGDSGGPLFSNTADKEKVDGRDVAIWANGIMGVNHMLVARKVNSAPVALPYGSMMRAVYLNQDYRTWINQQVQAVPEPTAIFGLAVGLAFLRSRRVKPA